MYSRTQISFSPSQHWIANNLFGLAFSLNGVELLHLNNVSTGCILLGGLFIYDVFWVSRNILQATGGSVCQAFCLSGGTTLAGHTLEVRIFGFSAQRGVAALMTESTVAECGSSSVFSFILSKSPGLAETSSELLWGTQCVSYLVLYSTLWSSQGLTAVGWAGGCSGAH